MILPKVRTSGLACAVAALLSSCAAPTTQTSVLFPPNNAAAGELRHVAVLPFSGPGGVDQMIAFESMIAQTSVNGQAYFTLVDRRTMQNAIDEMKLGATGLIDDKTALKLGKMIGAEGLYSGAVYTPPMITKQYQEERSQCNGVANPNKVVSKCTSTSTYKVNCTQKIVQFTLVPRLVKIATGQVIYQPTVTATRTSSACSDQTESLSEGEMRGDARAEVLDRIQQDIAPHIKVFKLALKESTEGLDELSAKSFKDGMAFAKSGRMDRACANWGAIETAMGPKAPLTITYNMAICAEAAGRLDEAFQRIKAVDAQLTQPDKDVNDALTRLTASIQATQATQEQVAPPPPPPSAPPAVKKKVVKHKPANPAPSPANPPANPPATGQ